MMKCQEAREDKVLSCQEVYVWYKDKHLIYSHADDKMVL